MLFSFVTIVSMEDDGALWIAVADKDIPEATYLRVVTNKVSQGKGKQRLRRLAEPAAGVHADVPEQAEDEQLRHGAELQSAGGLSRHV